MDIAECRRDFGKCHESPKLDSLRQKKFLLLLDRANINAKVAALPAPPAAPAADLHAVERQRLADALTACNSEIASIEAQISNSEKIIYNQKSCLDLPILGTENEVDNQKLRLQVPLFDPILNNPTIDDFWKKLVDYGEGLEWSEVAFKKALSNLLQQEAYKLYWIMRGKSLKEILAALEGSFHNFQTVVDLQIKLDSCTRQPGQSITNFMNSVSSLIYQTTMLRPGNDAETKAVEREILRKKLVDNATENAKIAIHKSVKKALKRGECLSYEVCLEIAKEAEHDEGLPISHAS